MAHLSASASSYVPDGPPQPADLLGHLGIDLIRLRNHVTQNGKADALPRRSVDLPEERDGRSRPAQVLIPVENSPWTRPKNSPLYVLVCIWCLIWGHLFIFTALAEPYELRWSFRDRFLFPVLSKVESTLTTPTGIGCGFIHWECEGWVSGYVTRRKIAPLSDSNFFSFFKSLLAYRI